MPARNTFAATRRSHSLLKRLRRGEGVTIQEVSDEFGIQYPQARADLKLLEELYELNTYRRGRTKVWEMPDVNSGAAAVGIAAALELGGVALDIFKDTPYGEHIDQVAQEYRRRVGPPYSDHLQRLSSALVLRRTWLPTDSDKLVSVLEQLLDCIALKRGVRIEYERADGEIGEYLLIPRRLIWYQGRLWLQAVDGGDQKLFDVAGIEIATYVKRKTLVDLYVEERLHDEGFDLEVQNSPPPNHDGESGEAGEEDEQQARLEALRQQVELEIDAIFEYGDREEEDAYFSDAFGIFATNFKPQQIEIVVTNSWAHYLRRYRLHPSQENEETSKGLRVRFHLGICPEFRSFLRAMIPHVKIVKPKRLKKELSEEVQSWVP